MTGLEGPKVDILNMNYKDGSKILFTMLKVIIVLNEKSIFIGNK